MSKSELPAGGEARLLRSGGPEPLDISALLDAGPDSMVVIDSGGVIVLVNAQAEFLFGYARDEMLGQSIDMLIPERFRAVHRLHVSRYAVTPYVRGLAESTAAFALHSSGTEFPVEISLSPLSTATGMLLSSSIRDVSDRQRIDQARRMFASLVETASQAGTFEVDVTTQSETWSDGYRTVFGFAEDQPALRASWLEVVHEDDRERVAALGQKADTDPAPRDFVFRIARAGETRWVRSRSGIGYARDGSAAKVIGTVVDVTELHQAGMKLRAADSTFEAGFDASVIGMGMLDGEGRFQRLNPAACALLGRPAAAILGKPITDLLAQEVTELQSSDAERIPDGGFTQTEARCVLPGGEIVWVEQTVSPVPGMPGQSSTALVQMQNITARRAAEQLLQYQAFHDPLTGLANRRLLATRLEDAFARARESKRPVGVLFFEVDQFKQVNDVYGHQIGDRLLVEIVRRMRTIVRSADTLARFGGDEFVIVSEGLSWLNAQRLLERIVTVNQESFVIEGRAVYISVSVGVVIASGDEDVTTVLSNSDSAKYEAKAQGRGNSQLYDAETQRAASNRFALELELALAVKNEELCVYYQPIVEILTREVVGFEALVRWEHPTRGLIPPMEFIPMAEQSGLIIPIGEWVLRSAAAQAQSWRTGAPDDANLTIAVNLSNLQLKDAGLLAVVVETLRETGLAASALHLEITESMVIHNLETALETLHALNALGVQFSVDDFGTGYAALGYLRLLPVQTIKIDKSFVDALVGSDLRSLAIIQAIVSLAAALELDVVVEGVETAEQLAALESTGAHLIQGYFFSRPLPANEISPWLQGFRGSAVS